MVIQMENELWNKFLIEVWLGLYYKLQPSTFYSQDGNFMFRLELPEASVGIPSFNFPDLLLA